MAHRIEQFEYSNSKRIYKHPKEVGLKPFDPNKVKRARIEVDGATVTAEVIPYTYGTFKRYQRNKTEKYGTGIYLTECERALYEYEGRIYKCSKWRDEDGTWHRGYVPYSGGAFGRHGTGLDPIEINDGIIAA